MNYNYLYILVTISAFTPCSSTCFWLTCSERKCNGKDALSCGPHSSCIFEDGLIWGTVVCWCTIGIGVPHYCFECSEDSHCSSIQTCVNNTCINPCDEKICEQGAICDVDQHQAICRPSNKPKKDSSTNCIIHHHNTTYKRFIENEDVEFDCKEYENLGCSRIEIALINSKKNTTKYGNKTIKEKFKKSDNGTTLFCKIHSKKTYFDEKNTILIYDSSDSSDSESQKDDKNNSIYIIVSVLGIIIILVIIFAAKKLCEKKFKEHNTHELNTYACTNDVTYAELDIQPHVEQRVGSNKYEESPYATIIGEMRPE